MMSDICRNCSGIGREKCWNCNGEGGTWKEIEGETDWEKCPVCWGGGVNICVNCEGMGKA